MPTNLAIDDKLINEAGVLGACRVMYKPILLESFIYELTSTLTRYESTQRIIRG